MRSVRWAVARDAWLSGAGESSTNSGRFSLPPKSQLLLKKMLQVSQPPFPSFPVPLPLSLVVRIFDDLWKEEASKVAKSEAKSEAAAPRGQSHDERETTTPTGLRDARRSNAGDGSAASGGTSKRGSPPSGSASSTRDPLPLPTNRQPGNKPSRRGGSNYWQSFQGFTSSKQLRKRLKLG
ncbi:unnamed protein product [Vitrella brassicaformis CCMP3155]|uniref:Uncharacterized protein n=1 Tax=Vitrella brassicaformis (strain CCMP3155) TaxID=1169540 RepID=A0A0G4EK10_VITBC|nr:unnamed protein product [Vitrella brassicaformis CCMP3155]|mmetsp:Transcript_41384/g.103296  ORF Transcript_41384/g.103296 Transcript_41384/m.103296 type:complete len:180 (+) Transcript_41384:52-591(+)|eukprot:CEL96850.1 unnamed protein product [Vitrella brassicaformis CCMP3155]